jgi:cysteine desulfurase
MRGIFPAMIYLDANATEHLRPEARAAALAALDAGGNPASVHAAGRAARRLLEDARERIASHLGARAQDVVFTSGATEANALGVTALGLGRAVLVGATEHDAVRAAAGDRAIVVPVDAEGCVRLDALEALLAAHPDALVCLMAANNETGVLHDIAAAASLCTAHGALLHVDAAQAVGRIAADYLALGAASLVISGHKLGGPAGAGALVASPAIADRLAPMVKGGGQERGRRGGTPGLPAIAGMAAALDAAVAQDWRPIAALRDRAAEAALLAGATLFGAGAARLPNTVCLGLAGLAAERQLIALDLAGIAVSAGSACSSGKVARSHVLDAMGAGTLAGEAIRVSLPWDARSSDIEAFVAAYRRLVPAPLRERVSAL